MTRIVHVNGRYLPEDQATVSIFDRGFLMADGVYEVVSVLDGRLLDFEGHMKRLARSLDELGMSHPMTDEEWLEAHRRLIAENDITDGLVYLQVTRGNPGDRDFAYPPKDTPPTVVMFTQSKPGLAENPQADTGLRVCTLPDLRWARRDIKTVQLLYPSMAKMEAKARAKKGAASKAASPKAEPAGTPTALSEEEARQPQGKQEGAQQHLAARGHGFEQVVDALFGCARVDGLGRLLARRIGCSADSSDVAALVLFFVGAGVL